MMKRGGRVARRDSTHERPLRLARTAKYSVLEPGAAAKGVVASTTADLVEEESDNARGRED